VDPLNNNGYERTLGWTKIRQAVQTLARSADMSAAAAAGFDTSKPFAFERFTPTLPSPIGEFICFKGC